MGFLDELKQQSDVDCKVARWLKTIDPKYRGEVEEALAGDFASKTIWRVIVNREGMVFSESVFARHRKGECGCAIQR